MSEGAPSDEAISSGGQRLTRAQVFHQSWPVLLANAAAPIVGMVDTFVIGRFSGTAALAGIGLGAVIYGIVYWGFGFLRMSTAGLAAQSDGAGDQGEVQAHLVRAVPLGFAIGLAVLASQALILPLLFIVFTAEAGIEQAARTYIEARLWGLPATLASIALMGWFVGINRARRALTMQIVLNVINGALSLYFVAVLGLGLWGVGFASSLAEWGGLAAGLMLAFAEIKSRGGWAKRSLTRVHLLQAQAIKKLGVANSNIFIRTLCLTFGFSFFGNAAASEGEVFLAANHIHLQFITMSALILDAFAHTAEARTGAAFGAKDKDRFDRAVRLTTEFSVVCAALCGMLIWLGGPVVIDILSSDTRVQISARTYLPFCALAPLIGVAAYLMDGVFIGVTRTRAMRNAGIVALALYLCAHAVLYPVWGAAGIWIAFLIYYLARALTLMVAYPSIRRSLA